MKSEDGAQLSNMLRAAQNMDVDPSLVSKTHGFIHMVAMRT